MKSHFAPLFAISLRLLFNSPLNTFSLLFKFLLALELVENMSEGIGGLDMTYRVHIYICECVRVWVSACVYISIYIYIYIYIYVCVSECMCLHLYTFLAETTNKTASIHPVYNYLLFLLIEEFETGCLALSVVTVNVKLTTACTSTWTWRENVQEGVV